MDQARLLSFAMPKTSARFPSSGFMSPEFYLKHIVFRKRSFYPPLILKTDPFRGTYLHVSVYTDQFSIKTNEHHQIQDLTYQVKGILKDSNLKQGSCLIYIPHATAAVTINENADPNIGTDFLNALKKLILEHDHWLHDQVDNNAASHIKSALVGPSESIPFMGGKLALGTWQSIFFCEFDGPRSERKVVVQIIGD